MLERLRSNRPPHEDAGGLAGPALDFLMARYPEGTWHALRYGFFGGLSEEELDAVPRLAAPLGPALYARALDWLLSEGVLEIDGAATAAVDLVLGPHGPRLAPRERRWAEAVGGELLALYEVRGCAGARHLELRELRRPGEAPRATRRVRVPPELAGLDVGEVFAARIVPWPADPDGTEEPTLAGGPLPFPRAAAEMLLSVRIEARPLGAARRDDDQRLVDLFLSQSIAWTWIQGALQEGAGDRRRARQRRRRRPWGR